MAGPLHDLKAVIGTFSTEYGKTPLRLKLIDLYILYALSTALIQFVYLGLVGSFPFNSFLAGFLSSIGTAVLAVCLRMQVNKDNKEFKDVPPERAFADWVVANIVLHLVVVNYIG
ncbi:putative defender against cell death [Klebsormidium nitens]|uniref:Dolichyl-diphosphooligosaccharide--protein glycosyltransferase subunit DAD1 n=1 Tax=Klebsormidium nitens TaxID=105231 RepID=A0A1Y1ICP2_KLENI|nr:putative defender against cell death [Klebsormidium nitens]|eukprot:GAQ88724.1 putative defender against cell death [Klebsormidium nitens]